MVLFLKINGIFANCKQFTLIYKCINKVLGYVFTNINNLQLYYGKQNKKDYGRKRIIAGTICRSNRN